MWTRIQAHSTPNRDPASQDSGAKRVCLGIAVIAASLICVTPARVLATEETNRSQKPACTGIGHVWWNELITSDPAKDGTFYAKVLGWKFSPVDAQGAPTQSAVAGDDYTTFTSDGEEVAGMVKPDTTSGVAPVMGWLTYVHVRDVDATATLARNGGGSVLREPYTDGEGNRLALVRDPSGNVLGLITPSKTGPC